MAENGEIGTTPAADPTGVAVAPAPAPSIKPPSTGGGSRTNTPDFFEAYGDRGVIPEKRYLRNDEIEAREEANAPKLSPVDVAAAGLKLQNSVAGFMDYWSEAESKPEFENIPGHKPSIEGYEDYIDNFIYSGSPEEDEYIKRLIDREKQWRQDAGFAGELFGAITDPLAWIGGAAAGAMKAGNIGIIATEVGAAAATEAALQYTQETRTAQESAFNIAAAGIVTSILGGASIYMSKTERATLENEIVDALRNQPSLKTDPNTGEMVERVPDSVGAQSVLGTIEENTMVGGKLAEFFSVGPGSRLLAARDPAVREMVQKLVDIPFALAKHAKGKTVGPSVEARLGEYTKLWYTPYTEAKNSYKAYRQRGGEMKWREFDAEVGKAMRRGDFHNIPEVQSAAQAWRKSVDAVRDRAIEIGALSSKLEVKGAASYFPRAVDFSRTADISPLRSRVVEHHMAKGVPENEAWEIADHITQKLGSGGTLPPGIVPIPKASGIQARTFDMRDEFMEDFLDSHASDVLARHFREMGAEIELRTMFGVDGSSVRNREGLIADLEAERKKHKTAMARFKTKHEDVKMAEMRLAGDETQDSRVAGKYRAHVTPGEKLDETPYGPVVSTRKKRGTQEVDLQIENPAIIENFDPSKQADIRYLIQSLVESKVLKRDMLKTYDDAFKALPTRKPRPLTDAQKASIGPVGEARLRAVINKNQKSLQALNNRFRRMMIQAMRDKGHDAIQYTAPGKHGTRFILFHPERAVRAPTAAEKAAERASLKRTMASWKKMMQKEEEWAEKEQMYKELIEGFPEEEMSIHQAVEDWVQDLETNYHRMQDDAATDAEKSKIRRELRDIKRDVRALIGRIQGHYGRPADATNSFVRAGRFMRALTATTQLGGVVVTSLPELSRPLFQYGLKPYAKGFMNLATNFKRMKLAKEQLNKMGAALEVVTQQRLLNYMGEDGVGMMSQSQIAFEKGVGLFTGLSHWTEAVKSFTGIMAVDTMLDSMKRVAGGTASEMELSKLARSGISKEDARRIWGQFKEFGDDAEIRLAQTDDWADRDAALIFEAAVRSEVSMVALEPGMSDKWLWTSSEVGKIAGQFMSFAQGATNRAMVSGLQRADAAFYSGLVLNTAMGAGVLVLKDLSIGKDPTDRNPAEMLRDSIEKSGFLGVWDRALTASRTLYGSNSPKFWGEQEAVRLAGPAFGRTIPDIMSSAAGIATGDPQWESMINLVPYNDWLHVRRIMEQTMELPYED